VNQAVHPLVQGFDAFAEAYERGRPGYATDAVDAVVAFLDLRPGRRVLDLGAGTGKLTRQLAGSGASIVAVEPMPGMRRALEAAVPGAEILDGTAEDIPLGTGSVDAAVMAQAFHWFDQPRALSELHRVIAPGGGFAIVVNRRDEETPWIARMTQLLEAATGQESPVDTIDWRERLPWSGLFDAFDELEFRHVHRLDRDGVIARVTSISTVAALDAPARADVVRRMHDLLDADPATSGPEVDVPYQTFVLPFRRRSPVPGVDGLVVSVNENAGGVPKPPVERSLIRRLGLQGDAHHNPDVHGGEVAAVCLYSQEAIERVRADGHQAFPGSYGENLTLLGIEWGALRAGMRLAIGDADAGPLLELTQYATPCQTQARWFTEARIGRISHVAYPEDARFYARVLREGAVAAGDPVRVLGPSR
jgi:MOSC domain-containing protein YiiM/SAM-dependent methyltransferase